MTANVDQHGFHWAPAIAAVACIAVAQIVGLNQWSVLDLAYGLTSTLYIGLWSAVAAAMAGSLALLRTIAKGKTVAPRWMEVTVYTPAAFALVSVVLEVVRTQDPWLQAIRGNRVDLYPLWLAAYLITVGGGFALGAVVRLVVIVASSAHYAPRAKGR